MENTPRGGITTFDFIVNKFIGLSGMRLLASLSKLVVKGREFLIASTSTSSVCKDSSLRLAPWVFKRDSKIFLADLICLSHTLPMLLAAGEFLFYVIHSPPLSYLNWLIFWWFISVKALASSAESPTNFVPPLDIFSSSTNKSSQAHKKAISA